MLQILNLQKIISTFLIHKIRDNTAKIIENSHYIPTTQIKENTESILNTQINEDNKK